jgi:periplasmic divalent cation tolerance protein
MLDEQLVACANILGPLRSLFVWKGERSATQEVGVLFKTDAAVLDRAVTKLNQLHPYECPAIAGWRSDAAPPAPLAWLGEVTK